MTASSATRQRSLPFTERFEQRRDAILEKAIQLFAKEGYTKLDLQVLADELGIGKGTL